MSGWWRTLKSSGRSTLVLFGVVIGLVVTAAPAGAVIVAPPSGGCTNQAVAKYSYVAATSGKANGEYLTTKEIKGLGCYWRSNRTTAKVDFRWAAIGHLYTAAMRVQLRDCTTGKWVHQAYLNYDNGTKKNTGGMARKTWSLNAHHKYRLRIWGTGSYARKANGTSGGIGRFYAAKPGIKHWKAWGGSGCS